MGCEILDIEIGAGELLMQASGTVHDYMLRAMQDIDDHFGKGFAVAHPELVGAMVQAAAADYAASVSISC